MFMRFHFFKGKHEFYSQYIAWKNKYIAPELPSLVFPVLWGNSTMHISNDYILTNFRL